MSEGLSELLDSGGSIIEDRSYGKVAFDNSGDFLHLTPRQRKAAKKRAQDRRERWDRAREIRADWTPEQFAAEEARLRAEADAIIAGRDAA